MFGNTKGFKQQFLNAFAKLQKANNSFAMSVCPSVWNNSTPIGLKFYEILYVNIFRKYVEKIQVFRTLEGANYPPTQKNIQRDCVTLKG
jgi:hypothetical protein